MDRDTEWQAGCQAPSRGRDQADVSTTRQGIRTYPSYPPTDRGRTSAVRLLSSKKAQASARMDENLHLRSVEGPTLARRVSAEGQGHRRAGWRVDTGLLSSRLDGSGVLRRPACQQGAKVRQA